MTGVRTTAVAGPRSARMLGEKGHVRLIVRIAGEYATVNGTVLEAGPLTIG